ncbi:MAG: GntR family transcriptional regulator [Flavobacteriia bacterium]|nr:GntR family transcriptional regulator [Flavobacteriia bacterium]
MLYIGQYNTLKVLRSTSVGLFLSDDENNEVLLPKNFVTDEMEIDSILTVFLFLDHEERITATTEKPYIELYSFAYLKCVDITAIGAFLDWGLQKHLFCPFKEQKQKMEIGKNYIVYLYLDDFTQRLVASAKYEKFIEKDKILLNINQEVEILVAQSTPLGLNVIINETYLGLIFKNNIHKNLQFGDKCKAYVKLIRDDGKIDIRLEKDGIDKIYDHNDLILNFLKLNKGFIPLNDSSSPDEIKNLLGISKRNFKQSCGNLYKMKKISFVNNGISLN